MKKTPNQIFIDSLHEQLNPNICHQDRISSSAIETSDEDIHMKKIREELERKIDELFGAWDTDEC